MPDCKRRPYRPRLIVGQARIHDEADQLSAVIAKSILEFLAKDANEKENNKCTELDWYVDQVHVVECQNEKDRFKIVETIQLGEPSASA